jgi:thiosulfate/3-mercaptopyruvate sulfurtransferase
MAFKNPEALVDTAWLADRLGDPGIRVVDGSSFLPNVPRDAHAEYRAKHIPGAVLVDIEEVSDKASPLPHMLPTPDAFARMMGALTCFSTSAGSTAWPRRKTTPSTRGCAAR